VTTDAVVLPPTEEVIQVVARPEPLRPTTAAERVDTIDILRGLALFGILAANIRSFSGPASAYGTPHLFWPGLYDRLAQLFIDTFVQGKFINIFCFLFGVGFAVQFDRALARGAKFRGRFAWRMTLLVLLGLVHGVLVWFGDILLPYALCGLVLLLFANRSNRTLAIFATIFLLVMPVLTTGRFFAARRGNNPPAPSPASRTAQILQDAKVYETGSYMRVTEQRLGDVITYNWGFLHYSAWNLLGLFLLGMLAWRKRFFHPAPESLPRYRQWMFAGFAFGITSNVAVQAYRWIVRGTTPSFDGTRYVFALMASFALPFLSLGYVLLVILICQSEAMRARLQRFGAVGRTALTNYLMQSTVGTLIFLGYGLGLFYGEAGPAWLIPLTIVMYTAQLYLSPWWLKRYRFGPVEWAWRRMTYGGPLPMRKREAASIPQAALVPAPPE
jgi:uncharacterized protein